MADEQKTDAQKIEELVNLVNKQQELNENLIFFSDQGKVNATMFKGMQLILKKLTNIEEKLSKSTIINGVSPSINIEDSSGGQGL